MLGPSRSGTIWPCRPSLRRTGRLVRLSLRDDAVDQRIDPVELIPEAIELPRIHPRWEHQPYRYIDAVGNVDPRDHNDRIVKIDLETRTLRSFTRDAIYFNEPQFVPSPAGTAEDDGVLLVIAFDAPRQLGSALGRAGVGLRRAPCPPRPTRAAASPVR